MRARTQPDELERQRWRRLVLQRVLVVVLGALVLAFGFGGFGQVTDRYSLKFWNVAVDWTYPTRQREKVTVVLLDDGDLSEFGETYPPRAQLHASVLAALGRHTPRAVMIDLVFAQERDDETFKALVREIRALHERSIPVFLAVPPGPEGARALRADMLALVRENAARPVQITRAHRSSDAQTYLLREPADSRYAADGPPADSAALALYRAFCDAEAQPCARAPIGAFDGTMEVMWSRQIAPFNLAGGCPGPGGGALSYLAILRGHFPTLECAYTPTLSVASLVLTNPGDPALIDRIEKRLVIYGAGLSGLSDVITPPFHHAMPGVFAHAMALDNLLVWGRRYYREAWHGWAWVDDIKLFEILALVLMLVVPAVLRPRLERTSWGCRVLDFCAHGTPPKPSGSLARSALARVGRLARHMLPGLVVMLAVIGAEVFVFNLAPLNWLGVAGVALGGKFAGRPLGAVAALIVFALFSAHRSDFWRALVRDPVKADVVRRELADIAGNTHK